MSPNALDVSGEEQKRCVGGKSLRKEVMRQRDEGGETEAERWRQREGGEAMLKLK